MSISFFSPIHAGPQENPQEKCAFLRGATQFYDFGQKAYTIQPVTNDKKIQVEARDDESPSWFMTALRVVSLFTVIIPLVVMACMAIYRLANSFELAPKKVKELSKQEDDDNSKEIISDPNAPNRLNALPEEILNNIFQFVGPTRFNARVTCTANNEVIEKSLPLKKKGIILALKQSYEQALTMDLKNKFGSLLAIKEALEELGSKKAEALKIELIEEVKKEIQKIELLPFAEKIAAFDAGINICLLDCALFADTSLLLELYQAFNKAVTSTHAPDERSQFEIGLLIDKLHETLAIYKQRNEINALLLDLRGGANEEERQRLNAIGDDERQKNTFYNLHNSQDFGLGLEIVNLGFEDSLAAIERASEIKDPLHRIFIITEIAKHFAKAK